MSEQSNRDTAPDPDAQVFVISVAAELAGMHAQPLRNYDRLGLVTPHRTTGGGRRYLQRRIAEMAQEIAELSTGYRRDLVPLPRNNALVVWKPRHQR
jgi:MerR family transcriptional regulator/heat shock protein HspR